MSTLRYHLRLLQVFFGVSMMNELQYRTNFVFQVIHSAISLGIAGGSLAIIFSHTTSLGGWRPAEMVMLLGVFYLVQGLIAVFIRLGMERLSEDVRQGTLDFALTKPVTSQFMVSFRHAEPRLLIDVALGTALLVGGAVQLGETVGIAQIAAFLVALSAGTIIVYSVRLLLATLTFWLVRTDNLMIIFVGLYEAGRYPVWIYPDWLRVVLTFVVPVAFATTVPTEALAGRLTLESLAVAVGVATGLLVASSLFWRLGLRNYTGASA